MATDLSSAANALTEKNESVVLEATTWQELAQILPEAMRLMKEQGSYNVFGYASLIKGHKIDVKPDGSVSANRHKNTTATLPGMEVAMNVIATGPVEWIATTDREAGIVNVGLWSGIEKALHADGFAEGLNITIDESEVIENAAGVEMGIAAFITRELNKPPMGVATKDLFDPNSDGAKKLAAAEATPLGMYKFQLVKTNDNGKDKLAVLVSTNHTSPLAKLGLTPEQAAAAILDGQGINRIYKAGTFGCPNWDYFARTMQGIRELGVRAPRMDEIETAVFRLAHLHHRYAEIMATPGLSAEEIEQQKAAVRENWDLKGELPFTVPEGLQSFDRGDPVKDREEYMKNGLPVNAAQKIAYFRLNNLPITPEEKVLHNGKLFEQRVFDPKFTSKLSPEVEQRSKTVHSLFAGFEKQLAAEGVNVADRAAIGSLKASFGKLFLGEAKIPGAEAKAAEAERFISSKLETLGVKSDKVKPLVAALKEQFQQAQTAASR